MMNKVAMMFATMLTAGSCLNAMDPAAPEFKRGDICRVLCGPLQGEEVKIQGTSEEIWGLKTLDDCWRSKRTFKIHALFNYFNDSLEHDKKVPGRQHIKKECQGMFYYVYTQDLTGFCMHPSWLKKIEKQK